MAEDEDRTIDELKHAERTIDEGYGKEEKARTIEGKNAVRRPTHEDYDAHMRTHIAFR